MSPGGKSGGCPICGKPPQAEFKPFCSRRCKDVDLSRWFGESYRIPAVDDDAAEGIVPEGEEDGR